MRSGAVVLAAIIFMIVALGHLFRVFFDADFIVDTYSIPMWISVLGFIGLGTLSAWLFRSLSDFI